MSILVQDYGCGATKGNNLVKKMLEDYKDIPFIMPNGEYDSTTCVIRNSDCVKSDFLDKIKDKSKLTVIDDICFYPKEYFSPKDYETGKINITPNTYAIHHYSATWKTEKEKRRSQKYQERLNKHIKKYGDEKGRKILNQKEVAKYYLKHPIKCIIRIIEKMKGKD